MKEHKILIVDDDTVIANNIAKRLIKRGFSVKVISNPTVVIQEVTDVQYDLILLDIKMPEVSGLDILTTIRKSNNKSLLPIIMFSACSADEDVINALSLGANDYVSKPVELDVLLSRIHTHLEIKDMTLDFARREQLEAVTAMITTYNHELNNALMISFGRLATIKRAKLLPDDDYQHLMDSQERIQRVVDKINNIVIKNELNFEVYAKTTKMVKI